MEGGSHRLFEVITQKNTLEKSTKNRTPFFLISGRELKAYLMKSFVDKSIHMGETDDNNMLQTGQK
jgi:hypothetical protein